MDASILDRQGWWDGSAVGFCSPEDGLSWVVGRGGDYELHLGQDLSIGYLSHDADRILLYLQESLTVLAIAAESSVARPEGRVRLR